MISSPFFGRAQLYPIISYNFLSSIFLYYSKYIYLYTLSSTTMFNILMPSSCPIGNKFIIPIIKFIIENSFVQKKNRPAVVKLTAGPAIIIFIMFLAFICV